MSIGARRLRRAQHSTLWQPTDLKKTVWIRPSGAEYVTWESLVGPTVAAAQAASPQTPVLLTATFVKAITDEASMHYICSFI